MFEGPEYPVSLSKDQFDQWLIKGRESKIGHEFMLVIWNDLEQAYYPVYAENLEEVYEHGRAFGGGTYPEDSLVAAYHFLPGMMRFMEMLLGQFKHFSV